MLKAYITIIVISILMVAALLYGFTKAGSPFQTRNIKVDQQKVTDITTTLTNGISQYYSKNTKLPSSLDQIDLYGAKIPIDSSTGQNYEYLPGQGSSYQLCTTFLTDSKDNPPDAYSYYGAKYAHPKGHHCFDLDADLNGAYKQQTIEPIASPVTNNSSASTISTAVANASAAPAGGFCSTQGTKMVLSPNGKGYIGCDVKVTGAIDLSKSYCEGQISHQTKNLIPDGGTDKNHYWTTLTDLNPKEEVKVFVTKQSGEKLECLPSLNN